MEFDYLKKILFKWLLGKEAEKEQAHLDEWLLKSEANKQLLDRLSSVSFLRGILKWRSRLSRITGVICLSGEVIMACTKGFVRLKCI